MFNLELLRRIIGSEVLRDLEQTYQDINRLEHPYDYNSKGYSNENGFSSKHTSFIKRLGLEEDNARIKQNIPSLQQRRNVQFGLRRKN